MTNTGERVWTLSGQGETFCCELYDRGHWGVEANILWNGRLLIGQLFNARAGALEWASEELADMEQRQARMH